MLEASWATWVPRLLLAVMAGSIPAVATIAGTLDDAPPHTMEIHMTASAAGTLQVFYDRGYGLTAADSATAPIARSPDMSAAAETYRVPLPHGSYRRFRIDPNDRPGRYEFRSIRILDGAGTETTRLPLAELRGVEQVALQPAAGNGVVAVTTADANDPQLLYEPRNSLVLAPSRADAGRALIWGASVALAVLLFALVVDRILARGHAVASMGGFITRRPYAAVVLAGIVSALTATYPLFLGRSLVSPGNGPAIVLYDHAPYSYGAANGTPENARGTDVGAMMWAILPYTMVQREAIAHGELPLWNRYNTIGEPLWGQGQTFILDPFHLASLAIPDPAIAMDARFIAARAMFAIGSGLAVAAVTGNGIAGVVVALAAPFVGHFTARFNHPAYFSIVYAPWILFAYARLARVTAVGDRARAGALLAATTWLQLVGSTPKEGLIALIGAHLAGMIGLLAGPDGWKEKLGRVDFAVLACLAAMLAGAPHWWIFLDTLSRAWTLYDQPSVQLAGWPHLVSYVLGAAAPGQPLTGVNPLVFIAALGAFAYPLRLARSGVGLGAVLAIAGLAGIACGVVPSELLMKLPLVGSIHHLALAFLGATVAPLLLVSGIGVAGALDEAAQGPALRLTICIAAATVACSTLVPGSAFQLITIVGIASVAAAGVALLVLAGVGPRPRPSGIMAVVLAGAMAVFAGGLQLESGAASLDTLLIQPRQRADLDTASPALAGLRAHAGPEPYRVAPVESVMFPGTQAYWRLEGIGGPDALRLSAIEALSDAAGVERTPWTWLTVLHPDMVPLTARYLDMLNVKYLVARPDQVPAASTLVPFEGSDLVRVIERATAWPRAFFSTGVERHRLASGLARRLDASRGAFASVDESDLEATGAVETLPHFGRTTSATDYVLTPNSTSFRVKADAPGLAVLSEGFVERDFQATLNGQAVPYLRVNHALKGVLIPAAGDWTVRFVYHPVNWAASWVVGLLGIAGFVLLLVAKNLLK